MPGRGRDETRGIATPAARTAKVAARTARVEARATWALVSDLEKSAIKEMSVM